MTVEAFDQVVQAYERDLTEAREEIVGLRAQNLDAIKAIGAGAMENARLREALEAALLVFEVLDEKGQYFDYKGPSFDGGIIGGIRRALKGDE